MQELSRELGCKIVEISALKDRRHHGGSRRRYRRREEHEDHPACTASPDRSSTRSRTSRRLPSTIYPKSVRRWYAIKIFERDDKAISQLKLDKSVLDHIENDIKAVEEELDDDSESIITNERYIYIASIIKACYKKKDAGKLSTSDKIDRVVTNRWLGLPIFIVVMFLVYYISMMTVGSAATDWANDGLFGDGWHLFGIGSGAYEEADGEYSDSLNADQRFRRG